MQVIDGSFVYSATDLNNYLACLHLAGLGRDVATGRRFAPETTDATVELIKARGIEHEVRQLAAYRTAYGDAAVVEVRKPASRDAGGLRDAERETLVAMASGAAIVYQATFFDGAFLGYADFLRRVERPSAHWPWSYEVIDTKLARSAKPYFLIQLCNYAEHLTRLQGTAPLEGYIVFGDGTERAFRMAAYGAYYRHLKASFLAAMDGPLASYPLEVAHCAVCSWDAQCTQRRERDDHPSLIAGIRNEQIAAFASGGLTTMTAIARAAERPRRMAPETFDNVRAQAQMQVRQRENRAAGDAFPYRYRFKDEREPTTPGAARSLDGFARLPAPSPGDVFFDIEGDPLYRPDRGLEYLFGLYLPHERRYLPFWATGADRERTAFEDCVDFLAARLRAYPDAHVYHYAAYKRSALTRLMGRFASRENEVDGFLRASRLVDLYPVVRQAMWISQPSYSLKKVEAFYGWRRRTKTLRGDDSIVMFENWLVTGDPSILRDIQDYNEDDCRSTHELRDWLLRLRDESNATRAVPVAFRPVETDASQPEAPQRSALEAALLAGIAAPASPAELAALSDPERERWLLGSVLQYHRRENKPEYWEYYSRCDNVDELAEFDRKALGGLRRTSLAPYKLGKRDRQVVFEYAYDAQEHDVSGKVRCPDSKRDVTIVAHDEFGCVVRVKMTEEIGEHVRALVPGPPISHARRQAGIERIAQASLDGTLAAQRPATSALLRGALPRLAGYAPGAVLQPREVDAASLTAAVGALDGSYLFVQGPPGSGKSTMGAAAIVDLLRRGKRVGLMANSHKALHGLLHKIETTAAQRGVAFTGKHKSSDSTDDSEFISRSRDALVTSEADGKTAVEAQLVSGTAYFWCEDYCTGRFDTIVIDEAGQVSLADALNASMAARDVVLLGDPQQLANVCKGSHPTGAGASILQHLLGEHDTIAPERGIFLDVTYRMAPDLAHFVSATSYDGRLRAAARTHANHIESPGLCGAGLAYVPVRHRGNGRYAVEEARRIVTEVAALLRGTYVRDGGAPLPFAQRDVLVVTPYNLQRRKIATALAEAGYGDVAVGTVDKFQGQEAPVVFYSMATSSGEDVPRGMTFLFDRNRFNVAISRAQCLSVLVCSPDLLDARCTTPEQMMLVSLLCEYVENATLARPPAREEAMSV